MKPDTAVNPAHHALPAARPYEEKVWDRVVRLFHWSLVCCIAANLFLLAEGDPPHRWVGYAAVALVGIRIVWGFVGSRHARFHGFFPTPARLLAHICALRRGEHHASIGHNPAGALMMLGLMALIISLGITGYMMKTDAFWGEEWLQNLHALLADTLQIAVLLHVLAAIVMSRIERVNLVRAMISGIKKWH